MRNTKAADPRGTMAGPVETSRIEMGASTITYVSRDICKGRNGEVAGGDVTRHRSNTLRGTNLQSITQLLVLPSRLLFPVLIVLPIQSFITLSLFLHPPLPQ